MAFLVYMVYISFPLSAVILFKLSRQRLYRVRNGLPPGDLGLPLIGETMKMISAYKTDNPEPFIDDRVSRFGLLFTSHVFGEPTVFSADPEVNRFILQNEGKLFEASYPSSVSKLLGKHSLSLMKGALHKRMHALTMSSFGTSNLRENLFVHIDQLVRHDLNSWPIGPHQVFLMDRAKKITFQLSMMQLMSIGPGEWTESIRKEYLLVIEGFFSIPISFLRGAYHRAIKARKKVADALTIVVKQRRKIEKAGEKRNDMLGALLVDGGCLCDEEIVDFLIALLVSGHETTPIIMTLAIMFLTKNPSALSHLKHEHDTIRAKKSEGEIKSLDWSDYKAMTFTQCVINETLRLANIISGAFRQAICDVNLKNYTIPKGWKIFASFRAIHMDNSQFQNARAFDPWRWQNKCGSSSLVGNVFSPFGGGPRFCPGYELAKVELSVFLHYFVTNFSWVPAEEDKLVFFPTTRTQKGYPITLRRLNPK